MIVPAPNVAMHSTVRSSRWVGMTSRAQSALLGRTGRQRPESGRVQYPACSVVSVTDAAEIVEVAPIHSTGGSNGSIISLDEHRNNKAKMELIVTLHGQHAATLDAGDDQWLHARTTSMGVMSPRISAAWKEKPGTRQLNCWLDGCLPENGSLARYRARARSMLKAAGVACETPKVAEILWANADAEFAGAVPFDTDRSPSAAHASGYERLTVNEIGRRLAEEKSKAAELPKSPDWGVERSQERDRDNGRSAEPDNVRGPRLFDQDLGL